MLRGAGRGSTWIYVQHTHTPSLGQNSEHWGECGSELWEKGGPWVCFDTERRIQSATDFEMARRFTRKDGQTARGTAVPSFGAVQHTWRGNGSETCTYVLLYTA